MRLATFLPPRAERALAGEVRGEHVVDFGEGITVRGLLAADAIAPAQGRAWPLAEARLLAPVPDPVAVYGIGLNYAAHAAETGADPPEAPIVFAKMASSVVAPDGPVVCPPVVTRLDYEGELCVVMGAGGRIAGYAVADDVSARDLQAREPQWVRAKGAATFCPYGPWITTADEVPDPQNLRLRTWVNGEERQNSTTADLIFGPEELVEFIAETMDLRPGDLILTGTPSGVGMASGRFLSDGDVVRIEIEGLGVIEHRVAGRRASGDGHRERPEPSA
jgi:2-keto-4-pentenoate hydratase/2-oxohepta-3-ene-1,7-dioic acid hydratase in catechol pathway